ncbi:MAG: helix-turn-helix transcriptional regulator [Treponema sp.]|nr:helix-turn-helix transcriptional regulator [Treponema sp.]
MRETFNTDFNICKAADEQRETIIQNIRERRRELHLTQENLAERSGLSLETIGKIERKKVDPSIETIVRIAHALDITPGLLYINIDRDRVYSSDRLIEALSTGNILPKDALSEPNKKISYHLRNTGRPQENQT